MISCINCRSSNSEKAFGVKDQYEDEYEWMVCSDCGANYLYPFPSDSQLSRAYEESYYGEGSKKFNPTVEKVLDQFRSRKAKGLSRFIATGDKVLDIGCADGEFLHQLKKFGEYELYGIELEGKAAKRAEERGGFTLSKGELKEDTFPNDTFQLISLIHVFEHLPDPSRTARILSRIIANEGHVYIEQPNISSWQATIFKDKWLHLDPPRHLNLLPEKSLIELMRSNGFRLESKGYFSPQFSPFGVQQSLLNLIFSKREVLYEHLKGNHAYADEYSSFNLLLQKLFHWCTFPLFVFTDMIASVFGKGGTIRLVFKKES